MINFLIRGNPNFAFVEYTQAVSVEELLKHYVVKVKQGFLGGFSADFYTSPFGESRRVSLYMQFTGDNTNEIKQWCGDGKGGTLLRDIYGSAAQPGKLTFKSAGSWSILYNSDIGAWFRIRPELHPDYAKALETAKQVQAEYVAQCAREEQVREKLENAMLDKLDTWISAYGLDAARKMVDAL